MYVFLDRHTVGDTLASQAWSGSGEEQLIWELNWSGSVLERLVGVPGLYQLLNVTNLVCELVES